MDIDDDRRSATAVALVSCTGILGELIRKGMAARPDVELVGDIPGRDLRHTSETLHEVRPDVVIWLTEDDAVIAHHAEMFCAQGSWPVIAVLDDGRRSAAWELRPRRTAMQSPSIESLVGAIRELARQP